MRRSIVTVPLLVLTLTAVCALPILLYTEAGLRWTVRQLQARVDGLAVASASGRLAGPFSLAGVRYANDAVQVSAARVVLDWRPWRLIAGELHVLSLETAGISVTLTPATGEPTPADDAQAGLRLPLTVRVDQLDARDTTVATGGDGEPIVVDRLALRMRAAGEELAFEGLRLEAAQPRARIDAEGHLPITGSGPLRVAASVQAEVEGRAIEAEMTAGGHTGDLRATAAFTQPLRLRIDAQADPEDETPAWLASATVEPFALSELAPEARPLRFTAARIEARGRGMDITGEARIALSDDEFGAWTVAADGGWDGTRWTVPRFVIADAAGPARIEGRADQGVEDAAAVALEVRWDALAWPPRGEPAVTSPRGAARLGGTIDAYRYSASAEVRAAEVPPVTLRLDGRGDLQGTRLDALEARWLSGEWRGAGTFDWSPLPRWDLTLDARGLDLAELDAGLDGVLGARIAVTGRYEDDLVLDARLDDLEGEVLGRPLRGRLHAALSQGTLHVDDIALASGTAELLGSALLDDEWRIDWTLSAPDLGELAPGWSGALHTSGIASGPPGALRTRAALQAQDIAYAGHGVAGLVLAADVDLAGSGRWRATMHADGARAGGVELGSVSLDTSGATERHLLELSVEHPDLRLSQRLNGALADGRWDAVLEGGRVVQKDLGEWTQRQPAGLTVAREGAALQPFCLESDGAAICAAGGSDGADAWSGDVTWEGMDLRRLGSLLPLDLIEVAGMMKGRIAVAHAEGRLSAFADAEARDGTLRYATPGQATLQSLPYELATLRFVADERGVRGDFGLALSGTERVTAELELPGFDPAAGAPAPGQAIAGRLIVDVGELSALTLFIPDVHLEEGRADLRLDLSGTVESPQLDGSADITVSTVKVLRLGTQLDGLGLRARMRRNELELDGSARMGGGELGIRGQASIEGVDEWEGRLSFEGENLQAVRLPAMQITASPRITLQLRPQELVFDGSLNVPKAMLEPVRPETSVAVSDDVVVVGAAPEEERRPFRAHGRLELLLGDEVVVQGLGFEGRLAGRLLLLVARAGDVTAQGEIRFVDGRYRAYGQNLVIKQGRVLYAGGPVDNPAIDVVASRQRGERGEIEVGVRVIGTARSPVVELYSAPAMDDADVLSYLIIGRPLREARSGEGADLYQAATSVAIAGGELLAERIGERFDLVEISIETGEASEDTALVLGRALSPRLYVRYIQGLLQDSNAIQFRYELSDKWTIETESGTRTGAGADIIYTLEH